MQPIAHIVKVTVPDYLSNLPIPDSIGGWFRLGCKWKEREIINIISFNCLIYLFLFVSPFFIRFSPWLVFACAFRGSCRRHHLYVLQGVLPCSPRTLQRKGNPQLHYLTGLYSLLILAHFLSKDKKLAKFLFLQVLLKLVWLTPLK